MSLPHSLGPSVLVCYVLILVGLVFAVYVCLASVWVLVAWGCVHAVKLP